MNLKKEAIVAVITGTIGSIVAYFIGTLSSGNWLIEFILYFLILILVIIVINVQQPIILMLTRPGNWKIKSNWTSEWSYDKDGKQVVVKDQIQLSQIGSFIFGNGISDEITGGFPLRTTKYRIRGELNQEGVIYGKWENETRSRNYYGVFCLKLTRNGEEMTGRWIGTENSSFHHGNWEWLHKNDAFDR